MTTADKLAAVVVKLDRWANTGPHGEMKKEPNGEFVLRYDVYHDFLAELQRAQGRLTQLIEAGIALRDDVVQHADHDDDVLEWDKAHNALLSAATPAEPNQMCRIHHAPFGEQIGHCSLRHLGQGCELAPKPSDTTARCATCGCTGSYGHAAPEETPQRKWREIMDDAMRHINKAILDLQVVERDWKMDANALEKDLPKISLDNR